MVRTQFSEYGGVIMAATDAGNQIVLDINTRQYASCLIFQRILRGPSDGL